MRAQAFRIVGLTLLTLFLLLPPTSPAPPATAHAAEIEVHAVPPGGTAEPQAIREPPPPPATFAVHYVGTAIPSPLMRALDELRRDGQVEAIDLDEPGRVFVLGQDQAVCQLQELTGVTAVVGADEAPCGPRPRRSAVSGPSHPSVRAVPDGPLAPVRLPETTPPPQPELPPNDDARDSDDLEGRPPRNLPIPRRGAAEAAAVELAPQATAGDGTITGTVTADEGGAVLESANVCAYKSSPYVYRCDVTDAAGAYAVSVPPGTYTVSFYPADHHIPENYDDVPLHESENITPVEVTADTVTPNIDASLAPGFQIIGRVTDEVTGDPLSSVGIQVSGGPEGAYYAHGYTGADGVYTTTSGLPSGSYEVEFYDSYGAYAKEYYADAYLPDNYTPVVISGADQTGIDAELAAAAFIAGVVTGSGPLADIRVDLYYADTGEDAKGNYTDAAGAYRLAGLGPVAYKVRFRDNEGHYLTEWHEDKPDKETADPVTLTSGVTTTIDAELTTGGTVRGTVTAEDGGDPLQDIRVVLYDAASDDRVESTDTDATGAYRIGSLPTGSYKLSFSDYSEAYLTEYYDDQPDKGSADEIAVTVGLTTTANAELSRSAVIAGTVTAEGGGGPLEGIGVTVYAAASGDYVNRDTTDALGEYEVGSLVAGQYKVLFNDPAGSYLREYYDNKPDPESADEIGVTAGTTTTVDAEMTPAGIISGTVTAQGSGAPLQGINVYLYDAVSGDYVTSTGTDPAGNYRLGALTAGTYRLRFFDFDGIYLGEYYDDQPNLASADEIVVAAGATIIADAALTPSGFVSGRVTGQDGGAPLEDISVTLYDAADDDYVTSANSDAAGVYRFTSLAAGQYKLRFYDGDGAYLTEYYDDQPDLPSADEIGVTEGMTTTIDVELARAGFISGRVTAEDGGAPLDGISVRVYDASSGDSVHVTSTDASGMYRVGSLADGQYKVRFRDGDGSYLTEYYDDKPDLDSANLVAVTVGMTTTVDAAMTAAGILSGQVTAEGGGALDNVRVSAYDAISEDYVTQDTTDASGAYSVGGLAAGSYKLRFYDNNGVYLTEYYDDKPNLASADPVAVTAGMTTTIDAELTQAGVLQGQVTVEGGGPLEDVRASLYDAISHDYLKADTTDAAGVYRLGGLTSGSYKVRFYDNNGVYLTEYYDDEPSLAAADPIPVTEGMTTTVDAAMTEGGRITGRVTDAESGAGIGGVSIRADRQDDDTPYRIATSAADGTYEIGSLFTGVYRVRFSPPAPYYQEYYDNHREYNAFTPVSVEQAYTTPEIDAALQQGYSISGTVTAADGSPLEDVEVHLYQGGSSNDLLSPDTDSEGRYELAPLDRGQYRIYFEPADGHAGEWFDDADAHDGAHAINLMADVTDVDAQLALGARITGTVTGSGGGPLDGTYVYVYPLGSDDTIASGRTDADGRYVTLPGLSPGSYQVRFSAPSGYTSEWYDDQPSQAEATTISVSGAADRTDVDAVLSTYAGGTITGTVTAADTGQPLTMWVYAYDAQGSSVRSDYASGGRYVLEELPPGPYRIRFSASSPYVPVYYGGAFELADADPVAVTAGATVPDVDQAVPLGGAITGEVTGSGGVPGVYVYARRVVGAYDTESTYTGVDGTYRVEGLEGGTYTVKFSPPPPFIREWYDDARDDDEAQTVSVALNSTTPDVDAALATGGVITGVITAADTGAPLPGAYVDVYSDTSSLVDNAYADMEGIYRTPGLPGGEYTVEFDEGPWDGYRGEWYDDAPSRAAGTSVSVPGSGVTPDVGAALERGGAISGWAYDADTGWLLDGVYAKALDAATGSYVSYDYTNKFGFYQIPALESGEYHIYFSEEGYGEQWYDRAPDAAAALTVTVSGPGEATGIDAHLVPLRYVYLPLVMRGE